MLEDCTQLDLKSVREVLKFADIMQGEVTETVYLVQLSLVHGVFPVYLKQLFNGGCHLVHVIYVEGYHPQADDVRDVCQRLVFIAFAFKLPGQGLFCLYP